MKTRAAVTICSINYLAKALVLFESYKRHHPENEFYVVLVDRRDDTLKIEAPGLNVIWVESLPIDNISQHAFAFDVIEFNTNVKPTALKYVLERHDVALYLDPDIKVYSPLNVAYNALEKASVVVTPHSNSPLLDGHKPDDLDFLKFGAFNLGFVGVARCVEGLAFLDWWSERCLHHGFYEPQLGLAVDQKWVNLAPCLFPNVEILHDAGLNVAFWNLHERYLSEVNGEILVNGLTKLGFIHFSSFDANRPEAIAHKQTRFEVGSRPDFAELGQKYADELNDKSTAEYSKRTYSFDYFEDGTYITPALRRFYAGLRGSVFKSELNPFAATGPVKSFAKKNGLLVKNNMRSKRYIFSDADAHQRSRVIILKLMRLALFVLGPDRYFNFMRFLVHVSSLRNQIDMFGKLD